MTLVHNGMLKNQVRDSYYHSQLAVFECMPRFFLFFIILNLHIMLIRFPKKSVHHKWTIEDAELSLVSASLRLNSASFLICGFGADISVCLYLSISKK